jgi:hypothetical protein
MLTNTAHERSHVCDDIGADRLMLRERPRHSFFGIMIRQIDLVENLQGKHPPLMTPRRDVGR